MNSNAKPPEMRNAKFADADEAVLNWFKTDRNGNFALSDPVISRKASELTQRLRKERNVFI